MVSSIQGNNVFANNSTSSVFVNNASNPFVFTNAANSTTVNNGGGATVDEGPWAGAANAWMTSSSPITSTLADLHLSHTLNSTNNTPAMGSSNSSAASVPASLFARLPVPTVILLQPSLLTLAHALRWRLMPLDHTRHHSCLLYNPNNPNGNPTTNSGFAMTSSGVSVGDATAGGCPPVSWLTRTAGYPVCAAAAGLVAGVPSLILALCPTTMKKAGIALSEVILAVDGAATVNIAAAQGGGAIDTAMGAARVSKGLVAQSKCVSSKGQLRVWGVIHGPGVSVNEIAEAKRAHAMTVPPAQALVAAAVEEANQQQAPVTTVAAAAGGGGGGGVTVSTTVGAVATAVTAPTLSQFFVMMRAVESVPGAGGASAASGGSVGMTMVKVTGKMGGSWIGPVVGRVP